MKLTLFDDDMGRIGQGRDLSNPPSIVDEEGASEASDLPALLQVFHPLFLPPISIWKPRKYQELLWKAAKPALQILFCR